MLAVNRKFLNAILDLLYLPRLHKSIGISFILLNKRISENLLQLTTQVHPPPFLCYYCDLKVVKGPEATRGFNRIVLSAHTHQRFPQCDWCYDIFQECKNAVEKEDLHRALIFH